MYVCMYVQVCIYVGLRAQFAANLVSYQSGGHSGICESGFIWDLL